VVEGGVGGRLHLFDPPGVPDFSESIRSDHIDPDKIIGVIYQGAQSGDIAVRMISGNIFCHLYSNAHNATQIFSNATAFIPALPGKRSEKSQFTLFLDIFSHSNAL
jgi:hypothetical protein